MKLTSVFILLFTMILVVVSNNVTSYAYFHIPVTTEVMAKSADVILIGKVFECTEQVGKYGLLRDNTTFEVLNIIKNQKNLQFEKTFVSDSFKGQIVENGKVILYSYRPKFNVGASAVVFLKEY